MPGTVYKQLFDVAVDQHGYLTTAQARAEGIRGGTLAMMAKRGSIERVSHGLYRLIHFPFAERAAYMEASLWPAGTRGIISHDSALSLYEISDVNPSVIHITLPGVFRVRRSLPGRLVIHHADLQDEEVDWLDAVPVTTVERTIRDCSAAHLGPELIRQAMDDARRNGLLTTRAAEALRTELLSV